MKKYCKYCKCEIKQKGKKYCDADCRRRFYSVCKKWGIGTNEVDVHLLE